MKLTIYLFLFFLMDARAQNMAETEDQTLMFVDLGKGRFEYLGSCKLHEFNENKTFRVVERKFLLDSYTLFKDEMSDADIKDFLEEKLPAALLPDLYHLVYFSPRFYFDVIGYEVLYLKGFLFPIHRLNIGVGNGNGSFINYALIRGRFVRVAQTFDSTLVFCDASVWKH